MSAPASVDADLIALSGVAAWMISVQNVPLSR